MDVYALFISANSVVVLGLHDPFKDIAICTLPTLCLNDAVPFMAHFTLNLPPPVILHIPQLPFSFNLPPLSTSFFPIQSPSSLNLPPSSISLPSQPPFFPNLPFLLTSLLSQPPSPSTYHLSIYTCISLPPSLFPSLFLQREGCVTILQTVAYQSRQSLNCLQ